MGVADLIDVEETGVRRGRLGRLSVGGDKGKIVSGATSGRTGARATRSGAEGGTSSARGWRSWITSCGRAPCRMSQFRCRISGVILARSLG